MLNYSVKTLLALFCSAKIMKIEGKHKHVGLFIYSNQSLQYANTSLGKEQYKHFKVRYPPKRK